jgi:hypothetical protein
MILKRNPIVFVFFLVLSFLATGYLSYSFFLPRYVEKRFLPSLGDQFFTSLTGQVFTIGLNEVSLGDLIIGDTKNTAVSIGSIHADYSLSSIMNNKIEQVRINGFTLNLEISAGKIIIPGLDLEKIIGIKSKQDISQQSSAISLPLQLDTLQVSNGFLNILYENQRIFIPFDLQIIRKEQTKEKIQPAYRLNLQIFPQGEKVTVTGAVDLSGNKGKFAISADSFDMQPFAFLLGELQEILSLGKASIKSNTEIRLLPFQLVATEINCELESADFKTAPISFGRPAVSIDTTKPLRLNIIGNEQQWNVTAHGSMVDPLAASIALDGSFLPGDNGAKGFGSMSIRVADTTTTLGSAHKPVIIKDNPELYGDFSIDITPGAWQAKIKSSAGKETLRVSYGQNSLKAQFPSFNIQGEGSADAAQMQISLSIPDVHVTSSDASEIYLPVAKLRASFNQGKKSVQEKLTSGKFTLALPDAKVKRDALTGSADVTLTGKIETQPLQDIKSLQISGELVVSKAKAEEKESSINIDSLEGRIPWQWSLADRGATGRISITGIKWKNKDLGSFESTVRLKNMTYLLDGRFTHSLLNGLVTNVTGQTGGDSEYQAILAIQMDATPFSSVHLGKIDPALNNSYLDGELGLDGSLKVDAKGFKGSMRLILQNGRLEFPEEKYELDNINLALLMPSLTDLRSAPAQKILFDKASVGDLTFEHGKVVWQLESPDSIFIEEGVVSWAGGRIFTNAVRISPDKKEFVVPIFCDRLRLTEILNQFGVNNAEGEGTVSGRIPLLVSKDAIRFEDGFLYSSPGQGGSVKVAAFDLLSAGIPKNSPQFAQVDFAAEALKNFQYNWVRLLLNSEGENLVMQMHMDGKPVQSLPFSYDSQTGLLQRIEDNTQGINQPIRLDVNFRLPLNRFIGYSGKIQDILKKIN